MPNAENYKGRYGFPGNYAFLNRGGALPALLQDDDPFTGVFDDTAAQNTCGRLQGTGVQDGDPADLWGLVRRVPVNGAMTPVLFLFKNQP
jgi:hypothetical protein